MQCGATLLNKTPNTMFILRDHNLLSKNYWTKEVTVYSHTEERMVHKFVWVDKANGRYHIESSTDDVLTTDQPLLLWWLVNQNVRDKMPYQRQRTEALHDMPEKYDAVVRVRLEHFRPNQKLDKLQQTVTLERNIIKNTAFGIIDKPNLVASVMPHSQQRSSLEITDWVQYLVLPVGNTMTLVHHNYLTQVA